MSYPLPEDEIARLAKLYSYGILDTPPEPGFERITELATTWFKVPIALISMMDKTRQFFKSCIGLDVRETGRDVAFCSYTILQNDVMVVLDATQDKRFRGNPLVTEPPSIRFYAGAPLVTQDGFKVGTLCLIDTKPWGKFTEEDKKVLQNLAAIVVDELDLKLARETADEIAAAKSTFLANMSHEIRTPIGGILGAAELLGGYLNDAEGQRYLRAIRDSSDHLLSVINDILDLSKLEADQVKIESIPFCPTDLFVSLENFARIKLPKGVDLKLTMKGEIPESLLGDPHRIRQILLNFLSNALKFTKKGQIHLCLSSRKMNDRYTALRWEVSDTGIGIPTDKQPQIFQKFYQADTSTSREYGGSGLGLSICKILSEKMQGDIGFQSTPGEGSTFFIEIPHLVHVKKTSSAPNQVLPDHYNLTVLIVEDNATNRLILSKQLEKLGCQVIEATQGADGVDKARTQKFDIIFMDCQMPVMDGFDATRKIREVGKNSKTPIIALTATTEEAHKRQCLEAGMTDFATKPISLDTFKTLLVKYGSAAESKNKASVNG